MPSYIRSALVLLKIWRTSNTRILNMSYFQKASRNLFLNLFFRMCLRLWRFCISWSHFVQIRVVSYSHNTYSHIERRHVSFDLGAVAIETPTNMVKHELIRSKKGKLIFQRNGTEKGCLLYGPVGTLIFYLIYLTSWLWFR